MSMGLDGVIHTRRSPHEETPGPESAHAAMAATTDGAGHGALGTSAGSGGTRQLPTLRPLGGGGSGAGVGAGAGSGSTIGADEEGSREAPVAVAPTRIIRPSPADRVLGALAYIGALSLMFSVVQPDGRFARLHTRVAQALHLSRLVWLLTTLIIWWRRLVPEEGVDRYPFSHLAQDAALLLVLGVPTPQTLRSDVLPWIITPLVLTWLVGLTGLVLAASGRSLDPVAATRANWGDIRVMNDAGRQVAEEERRQARRARQRQLERLQRTTATVGLERNRRERMSGITAELTRLQAEHEHIDRLLALGEISRRRYDSLCDEINSEMTALQREYGDLTLRSVTPRQLPESLRVTRQQRSPESTVESLAIVTPSGVPLFTYGYFQLDEALVAGILSAFDSISAEMFGSRVHKTELAHGQVLHFAHGEHVVILAVFIDEPSPRQIEQLRNMLSTFESANAGPLIREQFDPTYLHEVHPPFSFTASTTAGAAPVDH